MAVDDGRSAAESAAADWDGGWEADRDRKLRAWAALTPQQRLAWLEDFPDLAADTGVLAQVRARRAAEARARWGESDRPG